MKITRLKVKRLYGIYDYDVSFNNDLTFLYGSNGCGKTTVLNIIEAIITGSVYKLFDYEFEKLQLYYVSKAIEENSIIIQLEDDRLSVFFEGEKYYITINDVEKAIDMIDSPRFSIDEYFFNEFGWMNKINKVFNYVYLPLNRTKTSFNFLKYKKNKLSYYERRRLDEINSSQNINSIFQTEKMIKLKYDEISAHVGQLSIDFRNEILKSMLVANSVPYDFDDLSESVKFFGERKIDEIQMDYMKLLESLNILTKDEEENYNRLFDDYRINLNQFTDDNNESFKMLLSLILKMQEISKIEQLIPIAKRIEEKKSIAYEPIDRLLKIMNGFIYNREEGKELHISPIGKLYMSVSGSSKQIPISNLSSGEKQLFTFFANLIFNVPKNQNGIFVVDEPELSLHLSWQKVFVRKAMEVNPNIQFIFATHSPEILGEYRKHAVKLKKERVV